MFRDTSSDSAIADHPCFHVEIKSANGRYILIGINSSCENPASLYDNKTRAGWGVLYLKELADFPTNLVEPYRLYAAARLSHVPALRHE